MALPPVDLGPWLSPERIVDLPGSPDRRQAVALLADATCIGLPSDTADLFHEAVQQRELVGTTAIGGGVAIPHARLRGLDACRITIGRCPAGIDFAAPDRLPVRLLVMLATRDSDHLEHLRLLATLASLLRDGGATRRVLGASGPLAILDALRNG